MQYLEDDVVNNCTHMFNAVPRFGSIGVAAWEECARRSEVRQH